MDSEIMGKGELVLDVLSRIVVAWGLYYLAGLASHLAG